MKTLLFASASLIALAAPAFADTTTEMQVADAHAKMSEADCSALWQKASPNGEKLDNATAANYLSDVAKANTDDDTTIEQDEFMKACADGMVKSSDASGTTSTDSSTTPSETSDRTPGAETPTPLPQVKSVDGETSDRTPGN